MVCQCAASASSKNDSVQHGQMMQAKLEEGPPVVHAGLRHAEPARQRLCGYVQLARSALTSGSAGFSSPMCCPAAFNARLQSLYSGSH